MINDLIPLPQIITAFSTKGETYESSIQEAHLSSYIPIRMDQVHSATTTCVIKTPTKPLTITQTDATVTALRNVVLTVKTADCLPILLYHPSGVIGVIHAGRKGTENTIFLNCLHMLRTQYSITDNLYIWFGPAICYSCYEVDPIKKLHFDLINENIKQLHTLFPPHTYTLYTQHHCTLENETLFYSYRRDKTDLRHYAHIALM